MHDERKVVNWNKFNPSRNMLPHFQPIWYKAEKCSHGKIFQVENWIEFSEFVMI